MEEKKNKDMEGNSPKRLNRKRERERENLSQEEYNRDEKLCYYPDATCLAEESWPVQKQTQKKYKEK
jgi:hypothetical protein